MKQVSAMTEEDTKQRTEAETIMYSIFIRF